MSQRYKSKSEQRVEAETTAVPVDDDILTAEEAAAVIKVHPITMFVWAREGRGPPALTPPGVRLRRYSRRECLAWLRSKPHLPESDGKRMHRLRAQAGACERVEYESAEHGVDIDNVKIQEGVNDGKQAARARG